MVASPARFWFLIQPNSAGERWSTESDYGLRTPIAITDRFPCWYTDKTHVQETQTAGIALVPYIRLNIHRARLRNQVSYEAKIYPVLVGKHTNIHQNAPKTTKCAMKRHKWTKNVANIS